jgi:hypothetical protein
MLASENELISKEQMDKIVGMNCLLSRWRDAYKLGVEMLVLGWIEQRGSTGFTPLHSENPARQVEVEDMMDMKTGHNKE